MKRHIDVFLMTIIFLTLAAPSAVFAEEAALLKEANEFYKDGDYDEAARIYRKILTKTPDSYVANYDLGLALYDMKEYEKAVQSLEKSSLSDSNAVERDSFFLIGNCYYRLSEAKEGEAMAGGKKDREKLRESLGLCEKSIKYFKFAMDSDSSSRLVRNNYETAMMRAELLRKRLEEIEPPPPPSGGGGTAGGSSGGSGGGSGGGKGGGAAGSGSGTAGGGAGGGAAGGSAGGSAGGGATGGAAGSGSGAAGGGAAGSGSGGSAGGEATGGAAGSGSGGSAGGAGRGKTGGGTGGAGTSDGGGEGTGGGTGGGSGGGAAGGTGSGSSSGTEGSGASGSAGGGADGGGSGGGKAGGSAGGGADGGGSGGGAAGGTGGGAMSEESALRLIDAYWEGEAPKEAIKIDQPYEYRKVLKDW